MRQPPSSAHEIIRRLDLRSPLLNAHNAAFCSSSRYTSQGLWGLPCDRHGRRSGCERRCGVGRSELRRRLVPQTAVRAFLVVLLSPGSDLSPRPRGGCPNQPAFKHLSANNFPISPTFSLHFDITWSILRFGHHMTRPTRSRAALNSFGMYRSKLSRSNSRSFCTYKITSYLHILRALKVPCFQGLARFPCLTPASSAHPGNIGGACPLKPSPRGAKEGRY